MKNIFKISFLLLAFGTMTLQANAQKYGYLYLGTLLEEMPATKSADEKLKIHQEQYAKQYEQKVQSFQQRYQAFAALANEGKKTPAEIQTFELEAQKEQQELLKFEKEAQLSVMKKREELLGPLLKQVETAIADVAKENGYQFIFDASVFNFMLYASEADDVGSLVKKKLGL